MNETATNGTIQVSEYVRDATALMREYTNKLTEIAEASRAWINYITDEGTFPDARHPMPEEMATTMGYLSPAINDLSRHVSGMIEHGRVEGLDKLNLRMRLADLEASEMNARALSTHAYTEYLSYSQSNKSNRKR